MLDINIMKISHYMKIMRVMYDITGLQILKNMIMERDIHLMNQPRNLR